MTSQLRTSTGLLSETFPTEMEYNTDYAGCSSSKRHWGASMPLARTVGNPSLVDRDGAFASSRSAPLSNPNQQERHVSTWGIPREPPHGYMFNNTHIIRLPGSQLQTIKENLSTCFTLLSCQVAFVSNQATVLVTTTDETEIKVTIWRTRDHSELVVEIKRRSGDVNLFEMYAHCILQAAAQGTFDAANLLVEEQVIALATENMATLDIGQGATNETNGMGIEEQQTTVQDAPHPTNLQLNAQELRALLPLVRSRPFLHNRVADLMYEQEQSHNTLTQASNYFNTGLLTSAETQDEELLYVHDHTPRTSRERLADLQTLSHSVLPRVQRHQVRLVLLGLKAALEEDQLRLEEEEEEERNAQQNGQ